MMKNRFWKDIDDQETLEILNIKTDTDKLINVNKREGHKVRIELIKETTKRQTEELRMERINDFEKNRKTNKNSNKRTKDRKKI